MIHLAIDAGHGYTKTLSNTGATALFPSLICPTPRTVDLGDFGRSAAITIDDTPYLIGDDARRFTTPLWSRDKAVDDDTLRLILVAAAQMGARGPVRVATGLPLSWYGSQRQSFKEALRGYGGAVALPGQPAVRVWFESVLILPQGVAAAGPVLDGPAHPAGPYLIVDIGYRTTDYIVVTKQVDGGLDFDPAAAGSLEVGMHEVSAALAAALTQEYHTHFKSGQVEHTDVVIVRGQRVEITVYLRAGIFRRLGSLFAASAWKSRSGG